MDLETQFVIVRYTAAALFVLGLVSLGMMAGSFLGIQSMLDTCTLNTGMVADVCTPGIQRLNTYTWMGLIAGVVSLTSAAAMSYYLTYRVP